MTDHYFFVGGAGEHPNRTQLGYLLLQKAGVLKGNIVVHFINYPASIGPVNLTPNPVDFQENARQSIGAGVRELQRAEQNIRPGDRCFLVGYSLGAWVVSNFLELTATNGYAIPELKAAITIGSPRRLATPTGGGIAGGHGSYPSNVKHIEVSNWDDIVSNTPPRSWLRNLPFIEEVLTTGQYEGTRKSWVDVAMLFAGMRLTQRDKDLLRKYVDQTGHNKAYLENPAFARQIRAELV